MSNTEELGPLFPTATYPKVTRNRGAGQAAAARMGGNILLRRWFGCWIDFLALGLLWAFPVMVIGQKLATVGVTLSVLLPLAYFPLTEGLWGRSLGKLVSGTIVVDADGQLPGFGRAVVRTLTRVIEVNPFLFGGIPAGLVAAFTTDHQRLGDLLARTYVVPVKELAQARAKVEARDLDVFD